MDVPACPAQMAHSSSVRRMRRKRVKACKAAWATHEALVRPRINYERSNEGPERNADS